MGLIGFIGFKGFKGFKGFIGLIGFIGFLVVIGFRVSGIGVDKQGLSSGFEAKVLRASRILTSGSRGGGFCLEFRGLGLGFGVWGLGLGFGI